MTNEENSILHKLAEILPVTGNIELLSQIPIPPISNEEKNSIKNALLENFKLSFPLVLPNDESIVILFKIKYNKYSFGNIIDLKNREMKEHFIKMCELATNYLFKENKNLIPYLDWRNFYIDIFAPEIVLDNIEGNSYDLALFAGILDAITKNEIRGNYTLSGVYAENDRFISPDKVESKIEGAQREYGDRVKIIIPDKNGLKPENVINEIFNGEKLLPKFDYSLNESYYRIMEYKNDEHFLSDMKRLYDYLIHRKKSIKMKNYTLKVMYRIAEWYNHKGKLSESLEEYRNLIKKYNRMKKRGELYSENEIFGIMNGYGVLLTDLYQYSGAKRVLLTNVIDKRKRYFPKDQIAKTFGSLGQLYTFWNKLDDGERFLEDAVKIMEKIEPEESIRDIVYLSYNYIKQAQFDKANGLLKRALAKTKHYILKRENIENQLLYIYDNQILLNYLKGDFKKSIKIYTNNIKYFNNNDFVTAHILQYAGYSYIEMGKNNVGFEIIEKAIKKYKEFDSLDADLRIISIYLFLEKKRLLEKSIVIKNIERLLLKANNRTFRIGHKNIYNTFINLNGDMGKIRSLFSFIRT